MNRKGCKHPSVALWVGVSISAIPCTGPDLVWNATSTKSPLPRALGSSRRPPVVEIDWSLAFARKPLSNWTAAAIEPLKWTRGARRDGCGWGKWVIAESNYAIVRMDIKDYGSVSSGFAFETTKNVDISLRRTGLWDDN